MLFKSKSKRKMNKMAMSKNMQESNDSQKGIVKRFFYFLFGCFRLIFIVFKKTVSLSLIVLLVGLAFVCQYILDLVYAIPEIDPFTIQDGLIENSIIVDDNGNLIETLYGDLGIRTNIVYDDIGQDLIDAIVAIEDKSFFEHKGFNYVRLVGAVVESYQSGSSIKGTSTITQQLAKNIYLTNDRAIERKIKEAYYAILLERTLTKSQILEAYLNKINLGMQVHGVAAASQQYFSKDARDLNLIESAILAGIPKAPSRFAPVKRLLREDVTSEHKIIDETDDLYTLVFNDQAQDRYNAVIQQMYNNDMISSEEYNAAYGVDISTYIHPKVNKTNDISSYFGDMIKDEAATALAEKEGITKDVAEKLIYERGYIIHSTIDFEMQQLLEQVYEEPVVTDKFDEGTLTAVRAFQRDHDLNMDGLIGSNTLKSLIENSSYTEEDFSMKSYYQYMVHEDLFKINSILKDLGYLTNDHLFPSVVAMFNEDKNIINDETNKVILYQYNQLINEDNQLMIKSGDYYYDEEDNLILLKDRFLEFYEQPDRIQVVVKRLFIYDENSEVPRYIDDKKFTAIKGLYIFEGKDVLIDDAYKSKVDGHLKIDRDFFKEYPDFFIKAENGDLLIDERDFIVSERGQVQPQSAFVIIEQNTGQIKAIIGGRDAFGQNIYNRALVPHQPGSSIKPIGPYTVAIDSREWTAASVIDDLPVYLNKDEPEKRWPINWYEDSVYKYRGRKNLRQGIEDSLNVVTAKLAYQLGVTPIMEQLLNLGVSTIVPDDYNLAAAALGGMTYGISPLEMTAAYATYANEGVYIKPISFTKITDRQGNIIINNIPEEKRVIDEQVAFIIQDMMRTAVTRGYAQKAQIRVNNLGIPIAGKTGTTSDKRDALFMGYSPYYTAGIWFGNDVRLKMDEGSGIAAEFWQVVMSSIHENLEDKNFIEPNGLIRVSIDRVSGKRPSEYSKFDPAGSQIYSEIFLPGTVPNTVDDSHTKVTICLDSNKLATPYCKNTQEQIRRVRLEPYDYSLPVADQVYMVPQLCDIPEHQSEAIKLTKVIKTIAPGEIVFIRSYRLLLNDGTFVLVPKDSMVSPDDYTITFPNGQQIGGSTYKIEYITKPQTQPIELRQE